MKSSDNDEITDLKKDVSKCLKEMEILEKNREQREQLEKEEQESQNQDQDQEKTELVYPEIDES
jgi:hypothetical protein